MWHAGVIPDLILVAALVAISIVPFHQLRASRRRRHTAAPDGGRPMPRSEAERRPAPAPIGALSAGAARRPRWPNRPW